MIKWKIVKAYGILFLDLRLLLFSRTENIWNANLTTKDHSIVISSKICSNVCANLFPKSWYIPIWILHDVVVFNVVYNVFHNAYICNTYIVYCNYYSISTKLFFFNENTRVLSVKQEVHKIDYKYTVNVLLLKVLLFSMKKTSV